MDVFSGFCTKYSHIEVLKDFVFPSSLLSFKKYAPEPPFNKYGYLPYSGIIFHSGLQAVIVFPSCSHYKMEQ